MPGETESELIEKGLPCEDCGSSDAVALYSDGHSYCFACPKNTAYKRAPSSDTPKSKAARVSKDIQDLQEIISTGEARALTRWKITQATCRSANYLTRIVGGRGQHIAVYKDENGHPVFLKVRDVGEDGTSKEFFGIGDQSAVSLYGIETMGKGGKMVVIAEGEKDRLCGLQLWSSQFPVGGLPFGAESSGKAFAKALPILNRFEKVILALDMDKQGREGALELARMLPPGKAFIADFPEKDLHETFIQHGPDTAKKCLFNAKPYSPDGILDADELDASLLEPQEWGWKLPYDFLYKFTYGGAPGDVWVIGAGTGIGKSDLAAEIIATHIKPLEEGGSYERAAVFNYEAGPQQSLRLILGKLASKRFNIPDPEDGSDNFYYSRQDLIDARDYRRNKCGKLFINDHKGAISWEAVKERLRYLRHAYGITLGVVDPMAAMVAAEDDERKALDKLMAEAKSLAEELGIWLIFVSHLARPSEGKSHEEGGRVTLRNFRGSGAIVMWASFVIALERNQQGDEDERRATVLRMLKDRKTGDSTGRTATLEYNILTGRLEEWESPLEKLQDNEQEVPEECPE